jgi:hypothetical protein
MDRISKDEYLRLTGKTKGSKFHNKRSDTRALGTFDSKKEAEYVRDTDLRYKAGEFEKYDVQVKFPLVVNGVKICDYVADIVIKHWDKTYQIIDVKGARTYAFNLKWKLMAALYPSYKLTLA